MRIFSFASICMLILLIGVAVAASSGEKPEDTVARIYKDFAWEIMNAPISKRATLIEQPEKILLQYFDDRLTALILKDRACVTKTHEICRLDFAPIWASQDPSADDLKIYPATSSNIVRVQFRHPGDKSLIKLSYRMTKTARGWRISDIEYASWPSLTAILRATD